MPLSESRGSGTEAGRQGNSKKPHKETIVVAGLPVNVFSDPERGRRAEVNASVVVMFLLHGRTGSARRMETSVADIFHEVHALRGANTGVKEAQDLLIVTIVSSPAFQICGNTLRLGLRQGSTKPRKADGRRAGEHGMVRGPGQEQRATRVSTIQALLIASEDLGLTLFCI